MIQMETREAPFLQAAALAELRERRLPGRGGPRRAGAAQVPGMCTKCMAAAANASFTKEEGSVKSEIAKVFAARQIAMRTDFHTSRQIHERAIGR